LKKAEASGISARKIIVVPCIVKSSLYFCGLTTALSGCISCTRMTSASRPPSRKKKNANAP